MRTDVSSSRLERRRTSEDLLEVDPEASSRAATPPSTLRASRVPVEVDEVACSRVEEVPEEDALRSPPLPSKTALVDERGRRIRVLVIMTTLDDIRLRVWREGGIGEGAARVYRTLLPPQTRKTALG